MTLVLRIDALATADGIGQPFACVGQRHIGIAPKTNDSPLAAIIPDINPRAATARLGSQAKPAAVAMPFRPRFVADNRIEFPEGL